MLRTGSCTTGFVRLLTASSLPASKPGFTVWWACGCWYAGHIGVFHKRCSAMPAAGDTDWYIAVQRRLHYVCDGRADVVRNAERRESQHGSLQVAAARPNIRRFKQEMGMWWLNLPLQFLLNLKVESLSRSRNRSMVVSRGSAQRNHATSREPLDRRRRPADPTRYRGTPDCQETRTRDHATTRIFAFGTRSWRGTLGTASATEHTTCKCRYSNTPPEKFESLGTIWGGALHGRRRGRKGSTTTPHATLLDPVTTKTTADLLRAFSGGYVQTPPSDPDTLMLNAETKSFTVRGNPPEHVTTRGRTLL
jgi:hypothetical protein